MYNQYIPNEEEKSEEAESPPPHKEIKKTISDLLGKLKLDRLDRGDILLVLILLFLFWEGDNTDILLILGLVFLLGLWGKTAV